MMYVITFFGCMIVFALYKVAGALTEIAEQLKKLNNK